MALDDPRTAFRTLEQFTLADLEALRIVLRGGSVIDWHRLNFDDAELRDFLRVHEVDLDDDDDLARLEALKHEAIDYLRRHFDFPIPRSVEEAPALELFRLASSKGHKQFCACIILKALHIIHHLQGRELLFVLPLSDQETFRLVEEKVYRVVGGMLSSGLPVTEFLGGRKNRDSLYTKLLSKRETIASQIYDKLRFRVVTRTPDDLLPVVSYLTRRLLPFNYVIPGESTNTLVDPIAAYGRVPRLATLLPSVQAAGRDEPKALPDNVFSAKDYRVIHFVVDLPVRVPKKVLAQAPAAARALGSVIFVLTEFQIVDQETDLKNENGEASHAKYKERQRRAVRERLRLGHRLAAARPSVDDATMELVAPPPSEPGDESDEG